VEQESFQKSDGSREQHDRQKPAKEELAPGGERGEQKGLRWTVWLLIIMIAILLASSIADLVVSQRANESSRKQVKAMEQLSQSMRDIQRSIANLSRMIEPSPQEEEEPEEESDVPSGDGSI